MVIEDIESVQLPATFTIQPDFPSKKFIKTRLEICHDGVNLNGSSFTVAAFDDAASSLPYTPIVAFVEFDENHDPQHVGHAMHIENTEDGKKVIYDEVPIGVIPEDCNYSIEEKNGKNYVCADAYIWKDYSNYSQDILERDRYVPVSMEIDVDDFNYNKKTNIYECLKYTYRAISCCPDRDTVAMTGANMRVANEYTKAEVNEILAMMKDALREELAKYAKGVNDLEENMTDQIESEVIEAPAEGSAPEVIEQETGGIVEVPEEETTTEPEEETITELIEDQFQLSTNVLQSISDVLATYTSIIDGYAYPKYFLEDVDMQNNRIYVYSVEDGYVYAADFVLHGDRVAINSSFRRQVSEYRDYNDGDSCTPSAVSQFTKKLVEQVADVQNMKQELDTLRQFKIDIEKQQHEAAVAEVFENFSDLESNEEFSELKKNAEQYTVDALEKECYAIRGKSVVTQYTRNNRSDLGTKILPLKDTTTVSGAVAILERFKKG